jgi:hypothetical protein
LTWSTFASVPSHTMVHAIFSPLRMGPLSVGPAHRPVRAARVWASLRVLSPLKPGFRKFKLSEVDEWVRAGGAGTGDDALDGEGERG